MPPKKKGKDGKGGKGKKGGGDVGEVGGPLTPEQELALANANCTSLRMQLADRQLEQSRILLEKKDLFAQTEEIKSKMEEEQKATFELTRDMTRQYKGMQEELLSRIAELEQANQKLRDQLDQNGQKMEKNLNEKDVIISSKNKEISQLKSKMDDMAREFGEMMKQTLEKMRERIEVNAAFNTMDSGGVLEEVPLSISRNEEVTRNYK